MSNAKISVIVPVYNVEKYLPRCIESILNQTYKDFELILVDDGSLDNSGKICDYYANKDSRVKVIHKKNEGPSLARNVGLDIAKGDFVSFVDSDDWIEETTYEQLMDIILATHADIVRFSWETTDGENIIEKSYTNERYSQISTGRDVAKKLLLCEVESQVWKAFYQRKCWINLRFPVGRCLCEDLAVVYRAFEKAEIVAYVDKPFYKYRVNPNSITHMMEPINLYYSFLSFRENYDHAKYYYPEISHQCLSKAVYSAIGAYFHFCV